MTKLKLRADGVRVNRGLNDDITVSFLSRGESILTLDPLYLARDAEVEIRVPMTVEFNCS